MWVYGHCEACNSIASKFDGTYAEMCRAVVRGNRGGRYFFPPPVPIDPGAVARSVLMGMFALTPQLREIDKRLAASLEHADPLINPPEKMRLYLCRTVGTRGRISGPVGMFMPVIPAAPTGQHWGMNFAAQIWFPPVAWVLAQPGEVNTFLNVLRWADVTSWISSPVGHRALLSHLAPKLPVAVYPKDDQVLADSAIELLNKEITHYVRCDLPPDFEARLVA